MIPRAEVCDDTGHSAPLPFVFRSFMDTSSTNFRLLEANVQQQVSRLALSACRREMEAKGFGL